jgi:hypothetical protein
MRAFAFRGFSTVAVLACAVLMGSCARNHDLEFIEVTPSTQTLSIACSGPAPTDCGPTTTYLAIGHYIHPTEEQDLTTQVQWSTSNPDIITFADPSQPNVLFPTGNGCGTGLLVRATLSVTSENLKIGNGTVSVNCTTGSSTGSSADFTLTSVTGPQTVSPGQVASYTLQVTALSNNPTVQLAVNTVNLPPEVSAFSLTPNSVTGTGQATLSLTASSTVGTGQVQILGSDPSGGASVTVSLTVK